MDRGVDPFTFEIIRHKLFRVVDEAVATLELVSGTPSTAEGHDLIVALYTPEGGLLTAGLGFVNHVAGAAQSVKHILANYSEDPGIFEDDVFLFNDPFSGPMHPPDINMISPIHWEGKLAGWVANFVHATDIGGIDPGGFCPSARECYHEGFSSPGIKIVERGKLRKDVQNTILNMVRAPGMMLLDMKSQMAANYVAKQRMQKLYREYGYETVDAVGRELIRQSEQLMRQRLLELPDGQWRARHYYDLVDLGKLFRVELVATKERDTLTFDFSGSSEQAPIGINCSYWSTWGSVTGPAFTLLGWDMTWNEGLIKPFKLIAPPGTVINAHKPAPISIATIGIVYNVFHAATTVIAKMLGASEKYQKRPTGVWHGASLVWSTSGLSQWGDYMVHIGTEAFGGGAGARAFKDGVDMGGGAVVALVTRWTNAEMIELNAPLLYLYRRLVPDSAGPGKYRGGMCPEWAATLHDCPNNELKLVLMPGKGSECPPSYGVFGGYPGCNSEFIEFRGSNATEFPNELAATAGRAEHMQWGVSKLNDGDMLYGRLSGGGGYGDPLDRDPELVLKDVLAGLVTEKAARDVYGVVVNAGVGVVEKGATGKLRSSFRAERLGGKMPMANTTERAEILRTPRRINEYLQVAGKGEKSFVQCTWCGESICQANASWKDHAVARKSPLTRSGPLRADTDRFFLQEYFCPGCATMLDVEMTLQDDQPLYDEITRWPE